MKPRRIIDDGGKVHRAKITKRQGRPCTCGTKVRFSSKKVAKQAAARISKETGHVLEAYHCYTSHCYHVGHPPGTKAKAA